MNFLLGFKDFVFVGKIVKSYIVKHLTFIMETCSIFSVFAQRLVSNLLKIIDLTNHNYMK